MSDLRNLTFAINIEGDENPVVKTDRAMDELAKTTGKTTDELANTSKGIKELGSNKTTEGIDKSKEKIDKYRGILVLTQKELKDLGKGMESVGSNLNKKLTLPIVALGTASIHTVATFDDSMSKVKALSGATTEELGKMRDMAKTLGATTAHSASDAADAMAVLASSGYDTSSILATTPQVLSLASAGGLDLASTASILTGAIAQFGLEADQAGIIADSFAKAQAVSKASVQSLGEAMSYAGGNAANMGMDVEKTSAILGVFANAELHGSRAGTTFNAMFKDLTSKSKDGAIQIGKTSIAVYDAMGNIRDMGSVMADVEKATGGMTDAQRDSALQAVFQGQSMQGVNAFLQQGAEKYYELEKSIYASEGAATQMAEEMEDNIGGAFRNLASATEGLMIDLGDVFKDDIKWIAEGIGKLAGKFGELDEGTKKTIVTIAGLAAATGPLLLVGGKTLGFIADIPAKVAMAKTAFTFMTGPVGIAALAIGALITVGVALYKNWDDISAWGKKVGNNVSEAWEGAKATVVKNFNEMKDGATKAMGKIKDGWEGLMDFVKNPIKGTVNIARNIKDKVSGKTKADGSHASGLAKVPYDNYLANLHEGEEILTADDPRNQNNTRTPSGGSQKQGVVISFNPSYNIEIKGNATREEASDLVRQIDNQTRKTVQEMFYEFGLQLS